MLSLIASLAQNGWRATFRMLRHSENTIRKQPSKARKKYVRIRRRDEKGHKTPATAYQLVEVQEGREAAKTYRRVDDGGMIEEGEVEQLVLEKKSDVYGQEGRQREREKRRDRRRVRQRAEEERRDYPPANGNPRRRHRRRSRQPNGHPHSRLPQSSRDHTSHEISSVEMPRSSKRDKRRPNAHHERSSGRAHHSVENDGGKSPFSQPEMNNRDSHAFVFGQDTLTGLSQTQLGEGDITTMAGSEDPFAQMDDACDAHSEGSMISRLPENVEAIAGPSARQSVIPELQHLTARKTVATTESRRNSRRGTAVGMDLSKHEAVVKSTSMKQEMGVEVLRQSCGQGKK